jgi:hypothetical protein
MINQSEAAPLVGLFRRIATVVAAVIGLIFLGIGATQLLSLTWTAVDATVGECTAHTVNGSGTGRSFTQNCVLTWVHAGATRSATVDLGPGMPKTGQTIGLRVSGDTVVVATSPWIGVGLVALGAVLVVLATVAVIRSRRRRRASV